MHEKLIKEINKLPEVLTRQQLINWYIDNNRPRWGCSSEITTGKLIELCKKCGKKIQGQSKLEIHVTKEEQAEFIRRTKPDQTVMRRETKINPEEKGIIEKLYWDKGMTIEKLAKKYDCHSSTMNLFMQNMGIPRRQRGFGRSC